MKFLFVGGEYEGLREVKNPESLPSRIDIGTSTYYMAYMTIGSCPGTIFYHSSLTHEETWQRLISKFKAPNESDTQAVA